MIQQMCLNAAIVIGCLFAFAFVQGFVASMAQGFNLRTRPKLRIFVGDRESVTNNQ